ncbi:MULTISPECIES: LysE family transporter [unclassified Bacillus (in: firmicutes)]|uniref:LysE family transporter n=1 Tax=unclassified Bacillus (in: firmicutes) TaxID=185979 RepID=UPI0008DF80CE|nr:MULTISPECIES: LysE family transporter [unclassified Bacillus (in: firmicutes)]SFB13233.1 Threonine/homoserine/homoserine lactone efflux protein [Bacillus sp. UNCCL13]SFQ90067.1 Threonine/homoserine/homoserine lactone efflux protein [Bacillus sp. cl95]
MSIFVSYILLGLSLAAPIGPINAAQIDRGIKFGFFHAWILGVGAIFADAIYMLIVYIGIVQFIDTPFMKSFLWSFGAFILIYTGIEGLAGAGKLELKENRKPEPLWQAFLYGFFMSLSNPLTILFWLGIYGAVLAKTAATVGNSKLILYSCAIFIGLVTWDIWMAAVSSSFRRFLHKGILKFISMISGVTLIGFGIYFGYQAIKTIFL